MKELSRETQVSSRGMMLPWPSHDGTSLKVVGLNCPRYQWNYANENAPLWINNEVGTELIKGGPCKCFGDDRYK